MLIRVDSAAFISLSLPSTLVNSLLDLVFGGVKTFFHFSKNNKEKEKRFLTFSDVFCFLEF